MNWTSQNMFYTIKIECSYIGRNHCHSLVIILIYNANFSQWVTIKDHIVVLDVNNLCTKDQFKKNKIVKLFLCFIMLYVLIFMFHCQPAKLLFAKSGEHDKIRQKLFSALSSQSLHFL